MGWGKEPVCLLALCLSETHAHTSLLPAAGLLLVLLLGLVLSRHPRDGSPLGPGGLEPALLGVFHLALLLGFSRVVPDRVLGAGLCGQGHDVSGFREQSAPV